MGGEGGAAAAQATSDEARLAAALEAMEWLFKVRKMPLADVVGRISAAGEGGDASLRAEGAGVCLRCSYGEWEGPACEDCGHDGKRHMTPAGEAVGEVYELPTGERRVQLAKHARELPVGTQLYTTPQPAPVAQGGDVDDALRMIDTAVEVLEDRQRPAMAEDLEAARKVLARAAQQADGGRADG